MAEQAFTIVITDPCTSSSLIITAPIQTSAPNYFYTGTNPAMDFKLNPFTTSDGLHSYKCAVTYTC